MGSPWPPLPAGIHLSLLRQVAVCLPSPQVQSEVAGSPVTMPLSWIKNGEPEEGMGRQEEIEVGDIYSPASALLGCVGWGSPSIQGHSSSQVGLATQYSVSGFRSPLCPPLPSGLGQVRALSYYQPPGNCTIFVVPPHLCKWLLY